MRSAIGTGGGGGQSWLAGQNFARKGHAFEDECATPQ